MTRFIGLLATIALLVTVGSSVAAANGSRGRFTVRSTIDGRKMLPHRVHWLARPSAPVSNVAFSVDGRTRWIAHEAPYSYAEGGYLVTSFLKPGLHRFTLRATASDGEKATDTVVARVTAEPEPPADLVGTWRRVIDTNGAPVPGSSGNPTETHTPSGTYSLTFDRRWIRDDFPGQWVWPRSGDTGEGDWFLSDYSAGSGHLRVRGSVVVRPYSDSLAGGGAWCYFSGPSADYTWTVSGDALTLAPVRGADACAIRGFVWTGRWTRAG
jgi:hypothetical protein